ncbi:hypothetical protein MMC18_006921 [Xylographa bjoerkii]|nr:hypothetical protein [Xylographa bjoerkii]
MLLRTLILGALALLPLSAGLPHALQPTKREAPFLGIAYSPYNSDSSCKTASQVATDLAAIASSYKVIRIYGTDCSQLTSVLAAIGSKPRQVFAGLSSISNVQGDIQTIITAASSNWARINTIAIGNDLVSNQQASVAQVTAALASARAQLRTAGYTGPVVTVETAATMAANIALCTASDYCAITCQPFFAGTVAASGAGAFCKQEVATVQAAAGGTYTMVAEAGWPTQGQTNGAAVPGTAQQSTAVASLKTSLSSDLVVYTAFNNLWEISPPGTFGTEKYFGVYGNSPS